MISKLTYKSSKSALYILLWILLMYFHINSILYTLVHGLILSLSVLLFTKLIKYKGLIQETSYNVISFLLALIFSGLTVVSKYKGYFKFMFVFSSLSRKLLFLDLTLLLLVSLIIIRYLFYAITQETIFQKNNIKESPAITFFKYSIPILCSLCYHWVSKFPNCKSNDTISQWKQIHGEIPFSSVHSVGHTLFLKFILFFHDSYASVILVQILMVSALFGLILSYFQRKDVNSKVLIAVSFFVSFNDAVLNIIFYPWKDTPYSICVGIVTFSLIKLFLDQREWSSVYTIITGLALAGILLTRHNGVILFIFYILFFTYRSIKHRSIESFLTVLISISCVIFVNFLAFNVFRAQHKQDGTPFAIFGDGVVSVVINNGNISEEQHRKVEEIFPPIEYLKKYYKWGNGVSLLWSNSEVCDEGYETNPYKASLRLHGKDIIKLYFSLLPKNVSIMLKELVGSTRMIWQIKENMIINNCSVQLIIIFISLICCIRGKGNKRFIIPFGPVILNILSIMISATTNETRYLFPTDLFFSVLFIYSCLCYRNCKHTVK